MIKRLLTVILCWLMIICFVACNKNTANNILPSESTGPLEESETPTGAVFVTENIARITFYSYYGYGKGSDVPSENMAEFTKWLGTFTIDKKAEDILKPGTNTIYVEIEYLDGTIVKEGLDVISVDGVSYYLKYSTSPASFMELISKTTLD